MAYDLQLADRVRNLLRDEVGLSEQRMFGGLAFLVDGNMAVSVSGKGGLLLHVDRDDAHDLVAHPHVRPVEMQGRLMRGWLRVDAVTVATEEDLREWVFRGVRHARSLTPK